VFIWVSRTQSDLVLTGGAHALNVIAVATDKL
jgi:hypothetical protein